MISGVEEERRGRGGKGGKGGGREGREQKEKEREREDRDQCQLRLIAHYTVCPWTRGRKW